ncbi:hypothetical protein D9C73_006944 [Collichthys lucidus]|uniref:Uncharacterized protein n=1 Tax=Collichthys lucidus TaxID=240159 RepID=A0A4U5UE75_COLLU|nr:hypothetical protein D9C73_006944 [Collichthys lucidus]
MFENSSDVTSDPAPSCGNISSGVDRFLSPHLGDIITSGCERAVSITFNYSDNTAGERRQASPPPPQTCQSNPNAFIILSPFSSTPRCEETHSSRPPLPAKIGPED